MNSIADSDSYFNLERTLTQHQSALTLLQSRLGNPALSILKWLDLACGRGQIISSLEKNLSVSLRSKIQYHGYDINNDHSRSAEQIAEKLGMRESRFEIGELSRFSELIPDDLKFDFITFNNTFHEIEPGKLPAILFECVNHLSPTGCLFIYDMENLTDPELGAVTWTSAEIRGIMSELCTSLGAASYEPVVGRWSHRSCDGWNVLLHRDHLSLPENLDNKRENTISATSEIIKQLIGEKLLQTQKALESLTKYDAATALESADKESYLYAFWALNRAQGTI